MKEYNLLLVRYKRYDSDFTSWEMTGLAWLIIVLAIIVAIFSIAFGIVMAFEKGACNDVAEVTGLDVTYRNIAGCFVEVSDGAWVSADAYFVGKVQRLE